MATPEAAGFDPGLQALSNSEFVRAYMDAAIAQTGEDRDPGAILFDLIEDAPGPDPLLGPESSMPPLVTIEDTTQYAAVRRELIRRAIGYLGITKQELFGEQ
ncbi:MAG TPA: hypothetical protein VLG11_05130 [Candidatus Saccharimonadales bacterium]|nr:hypothetical protein [Candidatus Saccharimonadales bacterium]